MAGSVPNRSSSSARPDPRSGRRQRRRSNSAFPSPPILTIAIRSVNKSPPCSQGNSFRRRRIEVEDSMVNRLWFASLIVAIAVASGPVAQVAWSQAPRSAPQSPYLAAPDNLVAVRAGRMFDAKAGAMLNNQVILIKGDRIADVGGAVQIPPDARVIDLGTATVLPGMIDAHVHNAGRGDSVEMKTIVMVQSAVRDLEAGFTTTVDMDSRGGFGTVELRDAINEGLIKGPRMQVVGQSLNQRASAPYPNHGPGFYSGLNEGKNVNSPWKARAAVREAKMH